MKSLLTKIISVVAIFTLCVGLTACKTTDEKCASGHTWKLNSTTATCFDGGVENYQCEVCKETKTENVSAYGHDLVQSSYTAPTCKTNGEEVKKCSRCGFESKQTLLVIDHDYQVKSTTPSTCTVKGSQLLECSMCHDTKTNTIPLLNHDYKLIENISSTCIEQGYKLYQCSECKNSYKDTLPLLDHNYELINTTPSTCKVKGSKDYKCSICHNSYSEELPLEEHNYELLNTIPSTCVERGSKNYECTVCHDTYSEELPIIDHDYQPVTVPATCFTHGEIKEECAVCHADKDVKETPLLAHDFGADGYCTHCGIYETLFDESKLNVTITNTTTKLGTIRGYLVPLFKDNNETIPDTYFANQTITLTLTLYDKDGEVLIVQEFVSNLDANGKLTIGADENSTQFANRFRLLLIEDNRFSDEVLTKSRSFKIVFSSDGYEPLEYTRQITELN